MQAASTLLNPLRRNADGVVGKHRIVFHAALF